MSPEAIPEELKESFLTRYLDPEKHKLKLPLFAAYRLLNALGSPLGKLFVERQDQFEKILSARNNSILAHGVVANDRQGFDKFMKLMHPDDEHYPKIRFPQLSIGGLAATVARV